MRTALLSLVVLSVALTACGGDDGAAPAPANGGAASGGASGKSGAPGSGGSTAGASNAGAGGSAGTAGGSGATGGAAGSAAVSCGDYVSSNDFQVCTATYLAGAGDDLLGGVDIGQDGVVLVGAKLPGQNFGLTPQVIDGATDGAIVRVASDGSKVLSVTRLGARVNDVQVDVSTGNVAVAGDFGVALLDPQASQVLWQKPLPSEGRRVSAAGGLVAALAGKTVTILDGAGAEVKSFEVSGKDINDLVLDGQSKAVVVTGYKQDDGDKCSQYKSTFLRSYGLDGALRWTNYDWTKADVGASGDCADSTGLGLAVGRDGKLYYVGKSDGGNTVHRKDPRDLSKNAPVNSYDQFNTPYGLKGASSIGFYARFSLADGILEGGQFVVARKGDGNASAEGNAATPSAIAADEEGNMILSGTAASRIEGVDGKTVGGQKIGPYVSYEGFVMIVSPDFSKRLSWTSFAATGPSDGRAVAAAGKLGVYAASQSAEQAGKGTLITASPFVGAPAGGADGYLVVFPAP